MRDLIESFPHYFQTVIANTDELRKQVYRVRYNVFCKEFHFEREENCPGGQEKDEYDAQSIHFLVIHKASNLPAGCTRLIKISKDDSWAPLPVEKYCGSSLHPGNLHPSQLPRESLCEISRMLVSSNFRRRPGESESPLGNVTSGLKLDAVELRVFPLVSVALFIGLIPILVFTQRKDIFAMMEPWLAQHLQKTGFSFQQAGEPIEYHGIRVAFHYTVERALHDKDCNPILRETYDVIAPLLEAQLACIDL